MKIKEFVLVLIQLLKEKRVPKNRYREITVNQLFDGSFKILYHIGSYCRSSRPRSENKYVKQLRLQKSPTSDEWIEKMPCQCYGSPEQLRIEDLPKDWKKNLTIRKASSMSIKSMAN